MGGPGIDRRLQRQIIFAFVTVYALLLFVLRPNPTPAQVALRVIIIVLGGVGFVVVSRRGGPP